MRVALRLLVLVMLMAPNAPTRAASAEAPDPVARAFVPSPEQKLGEVRLIHRADADVVETLLYTKVLSRVIGEIRKKELANWGERVPGHDDAVLYLEMLTRVQQAIWDRLPKDRAVRDRRQKMWIDFTLAPETSRVSAGSFEMDDTSGEVQVLTRETLAEIDLSRRYVRRNMRLIAADSFGVEGPALEALLEPLPGLHGDEPDGPR